MPSSQNWKTDGAKTSISKPFPLNLGNGTINYTVKTETNIDNKSVKASKLTLQDEVKQGNSTITRALATSTDGGKTWILEKDSEGKSILDSNQIAALYPGNKLYISIRDAAKLDAKKNGADDKQVNELTNGNAASTTPEKPPEGPTDKELKSFIEEEKNQIRSREKYGDPIYPIGLNPKFQDCIKFSILKYQVSGLKGFAESEAGSRILDLNAKKDTSGKERQILGSVTLPIPGGIQDSNSVNWSRMEMDPLSQAFGDIASSELAYGKGAEAIKSQASGASSDIKSLRQGIISKFVSDAVKGSGVMQRLYGTIVNPNVELLFNGPELRTFSFSFKLSPRSREEASVVKQIIRTFKQSMSVSRSASSFLLQSPNTFAISYIFKDKNHPYLNKFKECALISCSVNYTPEGNYMAFDDSEHPSMVSYQLDLTFQELEPIYNDNYSNDNDTTIGF